MKRKEYRKPTMKVVELQHRTMLLQASNPNALDDPEDYMLEDDPFDF